MSHICSAPPPRAAYACTMFSPANLQREMDRVGMNQTDLARAVGVSPSAVNQWLADTATPTTKRVQQIAAALHITVNQLLTQSVPGNKTPPEREKNVIGASPGYAEPSRRRMSSSVRELPESHTLVRDVPIFGALPRGDGAVLNFRDGPASMAPRHAGLSGRAGVFGLYVPDASMSPWREPGEVVFVQRGRPAVVGGYAVATLDGGDEGCPGVVIGKLVSLAPARVTLAQFNPARDVEMETASIRELLYVLTQAEVFGF